MLLCLGLPSSGKADTTPLMAHPAWLRLDAASAELPFAWARRYLQLKYIAEEVDTYSLQLPSQLQRLHSVTSAAQKAVVTLLLDMVPAQSNVQEVSYILWLLHKWEWQMEYVLQRTASLAAGMQQSSEVLKGIGRAVEEMKANPKKRPIMQKVGKDFDDLYTMVHQRVEQIHDDLSAIRFVTLGLHTQVKTTTDTEEALLPAKWVAYYTTPLRISSGALSHLGTDFLVFCHNWISDERYPASIPFALTFNVLILIGLMLANAVIGRVVEHAPAEPRKRSFAQSLCCEFRSFRHCYRLTFYLCVAIMLNSMVDTLPQFNEGIPFLYMLHLGMAVAVALWASSPPNLSEAPDSSKGLRLWELALPIIAGQVLLHGDGGALLTLIGMGGGLLLSLVSLLLKRMWQSAFQMVWLTALVGGLMLTVMGFGRLTVPILMLIVTIKAMSVMLRVVNNSPALLPFTMARSWFVPVFTLFLCLMAASFLVACPGFGTLRNYWYVNAVPIMGFQITFGDAFLIIMLLLAGIFASNISRQMLENLGHQSHIIDASAVPVLHMVVNCVLITIFGCFVMTSLHMDITSLAFIGGGVSIGVGLAAKTILSNFFGGLVLIFSKAIRAGDVVEVKGVTGRILHINMRFTMIETLNNGTLLVPNEDLLGNPLINWSLHNLHVLEDIEIKIAAKNDMDTALIAMEEAAAGVPGVKSSPPPKALVTQFGENGMDVILKVWIQDVRTRLNTRSEIHKALRRTLAEHGIVLSMLVPQRLDLGIVEAEPHPQDRPWTT